MKKLFVVFFCIFIATIIGTSFTKGNPEKTTEVASIYGNLYAFQIGVFQDKESAENIRKQYEGIIVEKDGLNYVYIGILSNTSNIATRKEASKSQKTEIEITTATLYQNVPNPFNKETFISYVVPTEAQNAIIYLYNMSGVQLNKYDINTMGEGSITISANELYAGTYLYSLVVDGRLIDTKQMIITE